MFEACSSMATKRKRINWSAEEEAMLMELWRDNIDELRKVRRNSHVYASMALQFDSKTAEEVHIKISNFTQRYRNERKTVGPSGGSPSSWKYFDAVHEIVGNFKCNDQSVVRESFISTPSPSALTALSISNDEEEHNQSQPQSIPEFGSSVNTTHEALSSPIAQEVTLIPAAIELSVPAESADSSRDGGPSRSEEPCRCEESSQPQRPARKRKSNCSLQKEALEISRATNDLLREQFSFQKEIAKQSLELLKGNTDDIREFGSKIVNISEKQLEMQANFLRFMQEK